MLAAQISISRGAHSRILGSDRTAPEEVAPTTAARVTGDALPQQAQNDYVTVLWMNTCAPQLHHFFAQRLEDIKFKFLGAVITQTRCRVLPGLQTVGADDIGGRQMLDDEMIANCV